MDIIIKSFNRPYYLERCLRSIYEFVQGEFQVHVLDDGTPPVYLDKILRIFPEVKINVSPYYHTKSSAIKSHIEGNQVFNEYNIPSTFWRDYISSCSEIFLLLEDDIWITEPIRINDYEGTIRANNIVMLKLSWLGNNNLIQGKKILLENEIEEIVPYIKRLSPTIFKTLFHNKFKISSILTRLGVTKRGSELPLYTLYTVASAFFVKEYWLYLWQDVQQKVDESNQLLKAYKWYKLEKSKYAKTCKELSKTSFITSATNNYKDLNFDIFRFNYHLNEAWLNDSMDPMQNFPNDFNKVYIKTILNNANDDLSSSSNWLRWVERFKSQYEILGCQVD